MEEVQEQERWSDYDSSSAGEEGGEYASPPEEGDAVRSLRTQALNMRKRRTGGNAGEQAGQKRQRRVHAVQEQSQEPPPPMSEGEDEVAHVNAPEEENDEERHAVLLAGRNMALMDQYEQEYMGNHDRDLAWTAEKDAQEDKETRDAHYKPALLPLEREIEKALLLPGEDQATASSVETCPLCNSQKLSGVGLVRDNFNMMLRAMMDQIGQVMPQVLFLQLHEYFIERVIVQMREIREIQRTAAKEKTDTGEGGTFGGGMTEEDVRVENAMREEFARLCTPYRFYRHFTTHTIDPTLAHLMSLWRQNEVIRIVETECLLERHDVTGRYTFKPDMVLGYQRMMAIRKQTYEADTSKMLGFTTQRQLNTAKPNPLVNHHRQQFNPHSALNRQVFPIQDSPLLF